MGWFPGRWHRVLAGLIPVALLIAGCSSAVDASNSAAVTVPASNQNVSGQATAPSRVSDRYQIVNVDITDDGYQPSSVFLPVDRGVELIVRNRGTTEHHYRVVGLVPTDLQWIAGLAPLTSDEVDSADAHELHHPSGFVPFRDPSPHGIQPLGTEVHAYAAAGAADEVLFVPTNTGTFLVQDPLHPEMAGKVVVY